jgi:hypothetical protein
MKPLITMACGVGLLLTGITSSNAPSTDARIELVSPYRTWTKVNPRPQIMQPTVAALCRQALPSDSIPEGLHGKKYITVYVNPIGSKSMIQDASPHFPVGSVIVKGKLPARDSAKPEITTVMVKHEAGYDEANGNWEFFVTDGDAKRVLRANTAQCQSCHRGVADSDYVFRTYQGSGRRSPETRGLRL